MRAARGLNEVIVTLLLNFVALHVVSYAVSGPLMAEGAPYPYSEELPPAFRLPVLLPQTDAHAGVLFGIVLAVLIHLHFSRTTQGFALDAVGRNPRAARYAGIAVGRQMVAAMMIGGAIAGIAGGLEVIGLKYRLFHMFSAGYGYDGIIAAFMAGAQPVAAPLAALFLAGLQAGAGIMQRAAGVDATVVDAIQGLVVIAVATSLAWTRLRPRPPAKPLAVPHLVKEVAR